MLLDRVIFVLVALSALQRDRHPNRECRIDAVLDGSITKLVFLGTIFGVDERVAMEAGRNPLLNRRVWQQIAGQLLNRELIKRHVDV